jgi:hypothetical protein
MEKAYRFQVEISRNGKVDIRDGKGKPFQFIRRGDPTQLKLVPVLFGIPKSTSKNTPKGPGNGGGCPTGCHPGFVNGRYACLCP